MWAVFTVFWKNCAEINSVKGFSVAWFQQVLSTLKCHGRGQAFRDFLNVGGRMKRVFSLDCQTCCFSLESDGVTTVIDALFSIFPVRGIICVQTGRKERKLR